MTIREQEIRGLMEAYSQVYETPEVLTQEEEVFGIVANALISQGYSAIDVLEYFSSVDEEVIIEDVIALSEGTLIIENSVAEEYIEEQFEQLNEYVGAALRLGQAAVKGAQFAQRTGALGRASGALRAAGTAASRMAQQGGAKASAVVRPALGKAVQNIKGAASGALQKAKSAVSGIAQKVKGATQGAASKVPGGTGGKLANAAKFAGKAALGGAAFEGGMRGVSAIANKLSGGNKTAAAKPTPAAAKPAAKPAATGAAKPTPAGGSVPKPGGAKPPGTTSTPAAKPAGSAMDQWAKANPKLAASAAERDRTRGTSATTNPLMKDMKDRLPAPKSPAPSTAKTGFDLAKKGVNLAAGVDIFDLVKGYLLDEGYAETEDGAMVIMVNMSEEWRESIVEEVFSEAEGSYGKTPKAREAMGKLAIARREKPASEYSQKGEKTKKVKEIEKHTRRIDNGPDAGNRGKKSTKPRWSGMLGKSGRGKIDQDRRDYARDSAVEYTSGGHKSGPGTVTKNPKKLRKQKAMGEIGEALQLWVDELIAEGYDLSDYTWEEIAEIYAEELELSEAQEAREKPEEHEESEKKEHEKKYGHVRGEKTPMPPRGDKRREDFEKWYAKNVR